MDNKKKEAENQCEETVEETVEEVKEVSEVDTLKVQLCEANEKYLRVLAEYDNFRKRTVKERDGIYGDAYVDCVKNILPVIDNVERVLTLNADPTFMDGLKLIVNQMHDALDRMGVKEIECKTFDPNVHNAVMHIDDDAYGESEIVEVFQKGYIYGEKVIRYAMVKVAN